MGAIEGYFLRGVFGFIGCGAFYVGVDFCAERLLLGVLGYGVGGIFNLLVVRVTF